MIADGGGPNPPGRRQPGQPHLPEALRVGKTIICRPSQFSRLLIYRADEASTRFSQFDAELIPAARHDLVIDVSVRAA
ncbi:hypothetical protein [Mesorhizobium sp.]|uniref:hypothetical protein n=1 Tax=Mesorhizobium sp. TaxID=1871066 RepID=UPI000FE9EDAC|nr:hypothetical protein [Mesorhizobium sp.]RWA97321.1 MAG: hypothetical protein EOQ33_31985 [Mesorhizobium sp.]